MTGREPKLHNDIFFVCSLIENTGRTTKNHRSVVVNALGRKKINHLIDLADVYHSDNIDKVTDDLIQKHSIKTGLFDNIADCMYSIPTIWDIGKFYKRLIVDILVSKPESNTADILIEVYNSRISLKLEDYNSSLYYENPDYIYQCYLANEILR